MGTESAVEELRGFKATLITAGEIELHRLPEVISN